MKTTNLQSVIWKEGKYYVAQCLNVDVSSFGRTKKEALTNLREALVLYFEDNNYRRFVKVEKPVIVKQEFQHA